MVRLSVSHCPVGAIIFQSLRDETPFGLAVNECSIIPQQELIVSHINHVGLYIGDNKVIEATRLDGVIERKFSDFLLDANYSIAATINDVALIRHAIKRAQLYLGQPYNHSFYPDGCGFYCSELIVYAYQWENGNNYFEQYPMNFCGGNSSHILPYWKEYYQRLGLEIPQGLLGSHPQQLLRQTNLFDSMGLLT